MIVLESNVPSDLLSLKTMISTYSLMIMNSDGAALMIITYGNDQCSVCCTTVEVWSWKRTLQFPLKINTPRQAFGKTVPPFSLFICLDLIGVINISNKFPTILLSSICLKQIYREHLWRMKGMRERESTVLVRAVDCCSGHIIQPLAPLMREVTLVDVTHMNVLVWSYVHVCMCVSV